DLRYLHSFPTRRSSDLLGQNLGLVLEYNRNGNFIVQAKKIETPQKVHILPNLTQSQKVDNLTYRDLLWKSRFTTISVFEDEIIRSEEYTSELQSRENLV